jgi:hypothetical protein
MNAQSIISGWPFVIFTDYQNVPSNDYYSIPDKYLGRSPNFSLDVQDKSWTPDPISFSETL